MTPSEPQTEAGRALLRGAWMLGPDQPLMVEQILAIEREAQGIPLIDVERLTRALWNMPNNAERWLRAEGDTREFASAIAAEYTRLSESSPVEEGAE